MPAADDIALRCERKLTHGGGGGRRRGIVRDADHPDRPSFETKADICLPALAIVVENTANVFRPLKLLPSPLEPGI